VKQQRNLFSDEADQTNEKLYDFDGETYEAPKDRVRLNKQLRLVWDVIKDGDWRSLHEIAAATGQPEASVSARLRDLRKERFGKFEVERRRREGQQGTFEYRVAA
jgi:hypothetical protein